MKHAGRIALLVAILLLQLSFARPACAHFPPPVYISIQIGDEDVKVRLVANFEILEDWFGIDAKTLPATAEDIPKDLARKMEAAFEELIEVKVDRMPVSGLAHRVTINSYLDHEQEWEYVNLVFSFATKGQPRQVGFTWKKFDSRIGYFFPTMDAEIKAEGKTSYPLFTPEEPGYVWHRPLETPPPPEVVLPTPVPSPTLVIPAASVGVLLLLIVGFLLARRRGVPPRLRWTGAALGLVLGAALLGVAPVRVELPGGGFERPADEEALYIFETLLKNVYRAFDHDSEDKIYDTLEKSVSGSLLETVYLEVHQGLVMQDHGGAVCEVQKVEILQRELLPPTEEDAPYFRVRATWRLDGLVGHYGHTHVRVNEYEAVFTVALEEQGWKIADLEVLSQLRVEDPEREN